jgi:hypothetical protein
VSVTTEAAQEKLHLLVDHGVLVDQLVEVLALLAHGQLAVE